MSVKARRRRINDLNFEKRDTRVQMIVRKRLDNVLLSADEERYRRQIHKLVDRLIRYHLKDKTLEDQIRTIDTALAPITREVRKGTSEQSAPGLDQKIRKSFYATEEWKRLRYDALKKSSGRCLCCGVSAADGAVLRVDHIRSISSAPHLKADPNNLQVLCNDCNWGKGGKDSTDWRYGKISPIAPNGRTIN